MKNFILGILCTIFVFVLSSFTYYNKTNDSLSEVRLCEYKLNGHYYIVATKWDNRSGISIIHSPNCKCNKK